MAKYTVYARPTVVGYRDDKLGDAYSTWSHLANIGLTQDNIRRNLRTTDKYQGTWLTDTGSGNLSEDYILKNIKYASCHLNGKGKKHNTPARLEVRGFYLDIPKGAMISKIGFIIKCKTSNSNIKIKAPSVSSILTGLKGKTLSTVYHNKKVTIKRDETNGNHNLYDLVGREDVDTVDRNLTIEWSGSEVENVSIDDLNNINMGFYFSFKENSSSKSGDLLIDAIGMYVEYILPEYLVENGDVSKVHNVGIGEDFEHKIHVKRISGNRTDVYNRIKIPPCFTVVGYNATDGESSFGEYTGSEYDASYDTKLTPLDNSDATNYSSEELKTKNESKDSNGYYHVVRGTFFRVKLTNGYDRPIPYKTVHFKVAGQIYSCATDAYGIAWLLIRLRPKKYLMEYSFTDEVYDDCKGSCYIVSETVNDVSLRTFDSDNIYKGRYLTIGVYSEKYHQYIRGGIVRYHLQKKINGKWKELKHYDKTVNPRGFAQLQVNLQDTTENIYRFVCEYIPTGLYKEFFSKKSITKNINVKNTYNYDDIEVEITNKVETVDNVQYVHVNRHDMLTVMLKGKKYGHCQDNEEVWFEDEHLNLSIKYTDEYGRAFYQINKKAGQYNVSLSFHLKDGTNQTIFEGVMVVHEPPIDSEYNYRWFIPDCEESTLTLTLRPNTLGSCKIKEWDNVSGNSTDCEYNIQEYDDGDNITQLTTWIRRNTNTYIEFQFNFDPADYGVAFSDKFHIVSDTMVYNEKGELVNTKDDHLGDEVDWEKIEWVDLNKNNFNKNMVSYEGTSTFNDESVHDMVIVEGIKNERYIATIRFPIRTHAVAGTIYRWRIYVEDNTYPHDFQIYVAPQLPFKFDLNRISSKYTRVSRQLNKSTFDSYVLNCAGDSSTRFNIKSNAKSEVETEKIFIGPVPLSRSHSKPTGSTTQTLLSRQYKNRVILKKKGDYEDKVDVTLRLKPNELATIKGLCKLDTPTPVHLANVPAWNPLTVHGWIELYGTSSEKEINSKLYEAKLEWRYLSKELYSMMTITRNTNPVHTYNNASSYSVVHYPEDGMGSFFNVTGTDGLIEGMDNSRYAKLSVAPADKMVLTTKSALPVRSRLTLDWKNLLHEKSNVELEPYIRTIRVKRKTTSDLDEDVVFEYTYNDFTHYNYDDSYEVDTIINQANIVGSYITESDSFDLTGDVINLDYDEDYVSENSNEDVYTDSEGNYNYYVGSKVIIELEGNKLTFRDLGVSGNEYVRECTLPQGEYYVEMELDNQSDDINYESNNTTWISRCSVQLESDTVTKDYDANYSSMIVSPLAIPHKSLSFTRSGEDGLIYYYNYKEHETYKFRTSPYNQYKNGVDFRTIDGVHLFSTDNDLSPLCISNGLVMVAIHRYAGIVEFYRYNPNKMDYIYCFSLYTTMDNKKMSIKSFNDDKIVLVWGDTQWIMWRGRPFVELYHPKTDFEMRTSVETMYADDGSGVLGRYDINFNKNLLQYLGKNSMIDTKYIGTGIVGEAQKGTLTTLVEYGKESTDSSGNLTVDGTSLTVRDTLLVKGTLTTDGASKTGVDEQSIHLYRLNTSDNTWSEYGLPVASDSDGEFTFERHFMGVDGANTDMTFKVVYDGTDVYRPSESSSFTITVKPTANNCKLIIDSVENNGSDSEYNVGDKVTVTAHFYDFNSNALANRTVKLYVDSLESSEYPTVTGTTDTDGKVVFEDYLLRKEGYHNIYIMHDSEEDYGECNSSYPLLISTETIIDSDKTKTYYHTDSIIRVFGNLESLQYAKSETTESYTTIPYMNLSWRYYSENDELLDSGYVTTDENGSFSIELDKTHGYAVTGYLEISYKGDNVYDSCSETVTVHDDRFTSNSISISSSNLNIVEGELYNIVATSTVATDSPMECLVNGEVVGSFTENNHGNYVITGTLRSSGTYNVNLRLKGSGGIAGCMSDTLKLKVGEDTSLTGLSLITSLKDLDPVVTVPCSLECGAFDGNGDGVSGLKINMFIDGSKVSEATTDDTGNAEFTYTPAKRKTYSVYFTFNGNSTYSDAVSNVASFTADKVTPTVSVVASQTVVGVGGAVTFTGEVLTEDLQNIKGYTSNGLMSIYVNGESVDMSTVTEDSDGKFTYTYNATAEGDYTFVFAINDDKSDSSYMYSASTEMNIIVQGTSKTSTFISLSATNTYETTAGTTLTFKGKLVDVNGNGLASTPVYLEVNSNATTSTTTDSAGEFSIDYTPSAVGVDYLAFMYRGSDVYVSSTARCKLNVTVTVVKLFEDACNSNSGLSNYGTLVPIESAGTSASLEYDSTMNAYKLTSLSDGVKIYPITELNGKSNLSLEMEVYMPSDTDTATSLGFGVAVPETSGYSEVGFVLVHENNNIYRHHFVSGSFRGNTTIGTDTFDTWYKIKTVFNGTNTTTTVTNMSTNEVVVNNSTYDLTTLSSTFSDISKYVYGIDIAWSNGAYGYVRNIKAVRL